MPKQTSNLSPAEKRDLLATLLQQQVGAYETFPLTFAQEQIWAFHRLEPDSAIYNVPRQIQIDGPLNVTALRQALHALRVRHETLRTCFTQVDGKPVQQIAPPAVEAPPLPSQDLSPLSPSAQQSSIRDSAAAEARQPFDLTQAPLLRTRLLRLAADTHVLLLTTHHIIVDGWSIEILFRELAALYQAFVEGKLASLPSLPLQYADFAAWQRQQVQDSRLTPHLNYWRQQLKNLPGHLPFYTQPAAPVWSSAVQPLAIPQSLTQALTDISRQAGATLFMTLLAAFQLLLHRYSGQEDIVVGSPSAGRSRAELEGLIGLFVNMLVLRTSISENISFRTLLRQVRQVCLEAYAHQAAPFETLVEIEALQPKRQPGRHPFFQITFSLQNDPHQTIHLPDSTFALSETESARGKFDLELFLWKNSADLAGLSGKIVYKTDLFQPDVIERMAGHFQTLLAGIAANPDAPVSELPLLPATEREQLLHTWNQTQADFPLDTPVQQLVERQVQRTPQALAVASGDTQLTYAGLNQRANQLAHHLRHLGLAPGSLVALCLDRSPDFVVAALAILKAGAAYLPLDPDYPAARLAFMLTDAQVALLITCAHLDLPTLPNSRPVVHLDTDRTAIDSQPTANPTPTATADSLAYVIYTSGSTGRPKGVEIPQRGLLNLVAWHRRTYALQPHDRATMLASFSFDASVLELWPYLTFGASLHLPPEALRTNPPGLVRWLAEQAITLAFLPTPLAEACFDLPWPAHTKLRALLTGGDRLRRYPPDSLPCPLFNHYGPAEYSVVTTWGRVSPASQAENESLPAIGRPIANTRLYLLDAHHRLVPPGLPGELYIGGVGLAAGYRHRPDLTAEKFIPNPFEPGQRLYKSGDLARYRPDGRLEFLDRVDDQLKLRGFRIEPGEIEHALQSHPAVQQALVLARQDQRGQSQLAAYLLPANDAAPPSADDLRRWLLQSLPAYMVPAAFVALDRWPLTPNGKIDRAALPALPNQASEPAAGDTPAARSQTPTEEIIAKMWQKILSRTSIGVTTSFFALGGHSLLAAQLLAQIHQVFGIELSLRDFFEAPTIAGLVALLSRRKSGSRQAVTPRTAQTHPSLSFGQQRLWFLARLTASDSPVYNIPIALRLGGPLDAQRLEHSLNAIIQRHAVLRTTFVEQDGAAIQQIAPRLRLTLAITNFDSKLPHEHKAAMQKIIIAEAAQPFDLSTGPLLRASLLRLTPRKHILLLTLHHIVADGWSVNLLFKELSGGYRDLGASQPALPVQYADFAAWQRQQIHSDRLQDQVDYWRQKLSDAPPLFELPISRTRPPTPSFRGSRQTFTLPDTVSYGLRALSKQANVTLFITLLAAFKVLLHRYSGRQDIIIGTPTAGRRPMNVENLIGFFANTLVLRSDLSGDPPFLTLLKRVRQVVLEAHEHQDLPFEKLVEALQPNRTLSHNPLFQISFVLHHEAGPGLNLPEIDVEDVTLYNGTTKFDLTLALTDTGTALHGWFEYSTDLFPPDAIARMADHFRALVAGIAANPEQRLSALPLLTPAEQQRMLETWNATDAEYPTGQSLHHLFEAQAAQTPQAVAVIFKNEQLTYRELNQQANQLAHYLQKQGVGPDVPVAICLERSLEMVIGLLGILKAGGAYIPLDPGYPPARLTFMINDADPPFLLTQARLVDALPPVKARIITLDSGDAAIANESTENPQSSVMPNHLAYIIYTSGSTGQPKGAMIPHRAICNHMFWLQKQFAITASDRVLQKTPFSFDAAVWEFYAPLLTGGQLIMARPEGHRDGHYLVETIVRQQITVLQLVPSQLQLLLATPGFDRCHSLRTVFCGGEPLPAALVNQFFQQLPAAKLCNLYGPSEATIDATFWPCRPLPPQTTAPIGRPIANVQTYILDTHLQPTPASIPGELHIGGAGVGRGYLNRPDLTTEKFIPDPWSDQPGATLYKSGDLARYRPDGVIEFLGRIDHQVKVRGFRIEPGEIEAVLRRHPAVREVVVVARAAADTELNSNKRLVAYLATTEKTAPTHSELRHFLKSRLPDYMIPARFVRLDALPLTPNGKIDRSALPAPESPNLLPADGTFTAPRSAVEKTLVRLWQQVLGVTQVGLTDNFFALGGDSILSIQIVAKAGQAGLRLTPQQIFQHQTIAELAAVATPISAKNIEQEPATGPVPLTPIQHWFFEQQLPEPHHWNQAMLLETEPDLDGGLLQQALQHLLTHHDALRLRFTASDSGWQQHNAALDEHVAFLQITQTAAIEAEAAKQQASLNLTSGPLLRAVLFDLGRQTRGRLLLVIHHLAVDGVSWRILLEDLHSAYRQLQKGQPVTLPPKTTSYQQWSRHLRQQAQTPALEQEAAYWLAQVSHPPTPLPTDYAADSSANTEASARTVTVSLTPEETRVLLQEVSHAYQTQIDDILLTALIQTFCRWTGLAHLQVDLEHHGREVATETVDLSRTVGWFTTIFPVRLHLKQLENRGASLKSIKEQRRKIPGHGLGYGLLRYLRQHPTLAEQLKAAPRSELNFNYLGQFDTVLPPDSFFSWSQEEKGPVHSLQGQRRYLLEINGQIRQKQLRLDWRYSQNMHRQATIKQLAGDYLAALRQLIDHCQSVERVQYTPSDFPALDLDQSQLDDLIAHLDESI